MKNLVLITSIINTPNYPLNYSHIRSVFNREQRFEQTKLTIESIKKYIPDCEILLVECTEFNENENDYFTKHCKYICNLINYKYLVKNIYSQIKSYGEATMTMKAFEYINDNNLKFQNLFKISGRFYLNDNFNYSNWDNNKIVIKYSDDYNVSTIIYKIYYTYYKKFKYHLYNNFSQFKHNTFQYEIFFGLFFKNYYDYKSNNPNVILLNKIGLSGYISVNNDYIDY